MLGMRYTKQKTTLRLWSPMAKQVDVSLYRDGDTDSFIDLIPMKKQSDDVWELEMNGDYAGTFYTYRCTFSDGTMSESQDPYSVACGVNGKRSMILNLQDTDPIDFQKDHGPEVKSYTDMVITEVSVRDTTAHRSINVKQEHRGKYLGMVEDATLEYLKNLGVTHVQIMPMYDFGSIDESRPVDEPGKEQYNWGYDPVNYNVPEGSYASDAYDGAARIREVKQMVMGLHNAGIGVIMDVVYNHTYDIQNSCFQKTTPDYFYRKDGDVYSDAAACGNEIASEREMVRKYILHSVEYWMKEYHIDGFRFDLMGVLDSETMKLVYETCKKINPNAVIYGEGWTGGDSVLQDNLRALKVNVKDIPGVSAFSDDFRDHVKGHVFYEEECGFINGAKSKENDMRLVIAGGVAHPQVNMNKYTYTKGGAWAKNPVDSINYMSCHDNLTLWDKLALSRPDASAEARLRMNFLGAAILFTSQGVPFFLLGEEMLRTKPLAESGKLCENSYNQPIETNQIHYEADEKKDALRNYYKGLIALRKAHPLFRLKTAKEVCEQLHFLDLDQKNVVAYILKDETEEILVILNANSKAVTIPLKNSWQVLVDEKHAGTKAFAIVQDKIQVAGISAMVLVKKRDLKTV